MGSRTMMKQNLMRELVMNQEKPQKEIPNSTGVSCNNSYKESYHSISQNSDTLSSLTSTMIPSDMSYSYCKPYIDSPNRINFNLESNNPIGDDFSFISNDYNDPISASDSPYLIPNMYTMENKYSTQSYNDFSLQSSVIDNNIDSNSYNSQYLNMNNKSGNLGQTHDIYGFKTSFSCPVTGDQMTSTINQQRMSNSNSAVIGAMSLNYEDKRTQMKDRSKKESHNRIERKRRDFINQQITELSYLLPSQMMTEGEAKKNKGNILKNSVVYIQHLQNESTNTSNYLKETDLAFMLVDNYRKQIQELQQQLKAGVSKNSLSQFLQSQNSSENYSEYLMLHEHNRRTYQSNKQLLVPNSSTTNCNSNSNISSEALNRCLGSSYNKPLLSPLENGSAFKIEPSSAHSSNGTNSLSNTYRIDEESDVGFHSLHDILSPNVISPNMNNNYPPILTTRNDLFFNANSNHTGFGRPNFESMEC